MRRPVQRILRPKPTLEGAGVHLKRVFGHPETRLLDPFLLLDDFNSDNPDEYVAGFPWHPHRGIETVTYLLEGKIRHEDSLGNGGVIGPGDAQWMSAGGGIIHQEIPAQRTGLLRGFQLWVNIPASHKMSPPQYRDVPAESIPLVRVEDGVRIRVVCGRVGDVVGPVTGIVTDPEFLDVEIDSGCHLIHPVPMGHTVFAYVMQGEGLFDASAASVGPEQLVVYGDGDAVEIHTDGAPLRLLLVSGRPLKEPIAWYGPIVMNTEAELTQAFRDYESGRFVSRS